MRQIIVHLTTGYCGEDCYEPLLVENEVTGEQIDEICWEMAIENAISYREYDEEDFDMIDFRWEDYNGKDHDMHRTGGGSFQEEFIQMAS